MTLTAKDVAEIMRLLDESSFDSLSLEIDGVKLSFERNARRTIAKSHDPAAVPAVPGTELLRPVAPGRSKAASEPGLAEVTSPLLGIFYRAPRPGEPPFVDIGSRVDEDTMIGIVEVMKLMNSVPAGVKGTIVEILCENGALVEYGEVLLRVRSEA